MIGENWHLVTIKPVEFEKEQVEVEDCRKLLNILEKFIECTPSY